VPPQRKNIPQLRDLIIFETRKWYCPLLFSPPVTHINFDLLSFSISSGYLTLLKMPPACEMICANNLGVRYLNNRDFPNAVECFRTSLSIAKSNFLNLNACATPRYSASSSFAEPPCQKRLRTHQNSGWESAAVPFAHDANWTGVYCHGIVLGSTTLCCDPLDNEKCLSAIAIFNLACVFHSKALYESACHSHLTKAKSLYEHSLALLSGIHSPSTALTCVNDSIDFLFMAILNNMAYVDLELEVAFDGDSSLLFRKLFQLCQSLRTKRIESGTLSSIMNQQINIFLQNALFSEKMMNRLTAAAAA
jgi:hypothetical protein